MFKNGAGRICNGVFDLEIPESLRKLFRRIWAIWVSIALIIEELRVEYLRAADEKGYP